jgi:hypothetical protein
VFNYVLSLRKIASFEAKHLSEANGVFTNLYNDYIGRATACASSGAVGIYALSLRCAARIPLLSLTQPITTNNHCAFKYAEKTHCKKQNIQNNKI